MADGRGSRDHAPVEIAQGKGLLREANGVGAGLYLTGGALIFAVFPFGVWSGMHRGWLSVFGAIAVFAGTGLLVASRTRPLPMWVLQVLAGLGTANVTGTVLAAGPDGSGSFGVLYVFVSAFCFYYFPLWLAVLEVTLAAIAYAVALSIVAPVDPISQWVVITGAIVIVGALLGFVGQRMRSGLVVEHEAANRLRELDELKTAFLRAVSHELRTPLTALLGNTLTLRKHHDRLSPDQITTLLERSAANARRLEGLLVDLLDIDRVTRGVVEPLLAMTDLESLARQVTGVVATEGRDVRIEVVGTVVIAVEASKVERIIENLVANAVRHTPPGTPIDIVLTQVEDGVVVRVDDRGPGVPAALKEAIFAPFHQGETAANSPSPGTGIGLALVQKFAELHGGHAWIEDREGGGARFCVHLPAGAGVRGEVRPATSR